jgi:hypothetical protein
MFLAVNPSPLKTWPKCPSQLAKTISMRLPRIARAKPINRMIEDFILMI